MLVQDETEGCMSKQLSSVQLAQPHFSSVIDLDGDCLSDLFLTVRDVETGRHFYEIYLRRERLDSSFSESESGEDHVSGYNSFCLVAREEIEPEWNFKFADVDRDGMIDMVYTKGTELTVHYNRLLNEKRQNEADEEGIHLFITKNVCASTKRAINLIKDMYLAPKKAHGSESPFVQRIDLKQVIPNAKELYQVREDLPAQFFFGDVNSDGYPDISITARLAAGGSQTFVLMNLPCTLRQCSEKLTQSSRRFFSTQDTIGDFNLFDQLQEVIEYSQFYKAQLSKYKNSMYATFFDLIEDSYFDLLLVSQDKAGSARIHALYNNMDRTPFFLKAHTITNSSLGSAHTGVSYRCVVSSVADGKYIAVAGSPGQTAYQALQLPFSHVGIGRSNNFIEQFTVVIYNEGKRAMRQWSPIIPKSILFINADMSSEPKLW